MCAVGLQCGSAECREVLQLAHHSAAMLHVRVLSGQVVASIPVEELTDVRSLKQQLNRVHGFPTRFRQRLLLGDKPLADSTLLDSPMDLALVILPHRRRSWTSSWLRLRTAPHLRSATLQGVYGYRAYNEGTETGRHTSQREFLSRRIDLTCQKAQP